MLHYGLYTTFRACHQLPSDKESAAHGDAVFTLAGQDGQFTHNNGSFWFFFLSLERLDDRPHGCGKKCP